MSAENDRSGDLQRACDRYLEHERRCDAEGTWIRREVEEAMADSTIKAWLEAHPNYISQGIVMDVIERLHVSGFGPQPNRRGNTLYAMVHDACDEVDRLRSWIAQIQQLLSNAQRLGNDWRSATSIYRESNEAGERAVGLLLDVDTYVASMHVQSPLTARGHSTARTEVTARRVLTGEPQS